MTEASASSAPEGVPRDGYRTHGFLFSDLRQYTRYVETHGDEAAAALLARYRVLVREAVSRFGGAEIKTEGDSFYIVFPSASGAVRCGLAIVEAAAAPPDGEETIAVGVGVHAGESVATAEGYVGSAVNIAARICARALAGEVLVSETVRGLTRTLLPVRFEPRGHPRLKGIAEPLELYAVLPPGGALATGRRIGRAGPWGLAAPLAALLVAVLAVGGMAFAFLGGLGGGDVSELPTRATALSPTSLPAASPARPRVTVGPTLTAMSPPPFPRSIGERRLVEQVPTAYRARCGPSGDDLPGATTSIACPLAFGAEVDQVWYDRFAGRAEMRLAIDRVIRQRGLDEGGCSVISPDGHRPWQVGSLWSGQQACFEEGGDAWIWWSYEEELVVARVVRRGASWEPLLGWWDRYSILLRNSP